MCPTTSIPAEEIERFVWGELTEHPQAAAKLEACSGLNTTQRIELLAQLVQRIEYDGSTGDLFIRLFPDEKETR